MCVTTKRSQTEQIVAILGYAPGSEYSFRSLGAQSLCGFVASSKGLAE